ncbi:RNA polymerase sigma factor [Rhodococcus sp. NPDC003382]|uniref:RNA polymerase sigma factor n=1 Tax=Rhodococcus sp. O3 TaxID=3404919 RepID=UPI003B67CFC4
MSEAELIERSRAGDQAAFAELVARSRDQTWAVCLQITGHRHDAEDALQDTLTAAWQNLASFRGTARFGTWLYRIATNASLAIVRKRRETPEDEIDNGEHTGRSVADSIADTDMVRQALAALPEQFRVAIVLREYADMSYAEIAEHQGIPVQTVKSRINRARAQLVEKLAPSMLDADALEP